MPTPSPALPADRRRCNARRRSKSKCSHDGATRTCSTQCAGAFGRRQRRSCFSKARRRRTDARGIHHVFARTVKDLICRHRAMHGHFVPRKAGWDTHGLPVEIEVEKRLASAASNTSNTSASRSSIGAAARIGVHVSRRLGETVRAHRVLARLRPSVRHVHAQLRRKRVVGAQDVVGQGPACTRTQDSCRTARVAEPRCRVTKSRRDTKTSKIRRVVHRPRSCRTLPARNAARRILVWTTTPWTLVVERGVAVHPDFDLRRSCAKPTWAGRVRQRGRYSSLSRASPRYWAKGGRERWEEVARFTGRELAGMRYRGRSIGCRIPRVRRTKSSSPKNLCRPTMAPASCTCRRRLAPTTTQPASGTISRSCSQSTRAGVSRRHAAHWRNVRQGCRHAIIGGTRTARRVVEDRAGSRTRIRIAGGAARRCCITRGRHGLCGPRPYKDRMMARNARVDWHPVETGSGRFGEWLEQQRRLGDLARPLLGHAVTGVGERRGSGRDRSDRQLRGTRAALGARPAGFRSAQTAHRRVHVARASRDAARCVACREVIDAWFDSGSMPFAQWHYPFENTDNARAAVSRRLHRRRRGSDARMVLLAARHCDGARRRAAEQQRRTGGAVSSRDRQRHGARRQRTENVQEQGQHCRAVGGARPHGADAARLFVVAASQVWLPRNFDEQAIRELAGRFLLTLKNTYSGMFAQYANFGWEPVGDDPPVADRAAPRPVDSLATRNGRSLRRTRG